MEKNVLKELVMLPTLSGFEFMALEEIKRITGMSPLMDNIGNYYLWQSGKDVGKPTVMISAHLDEIGAVILGKTPEGLYRIGRRGGIDPKVLEGQRVWCYPDPTTDPGTYVTGVIGKTAIHLEKPEDRKKAEELSDITVDFGTIDLPIGSPIVPEKHYTELAGDLISAPGLDDKAGIWVVLDLLDKFKGSKLSYNLVFVLMAQEEVGLRGAQVAAKKVNPDISIDLDVSFAVDDGHGGKEIPAGSIKLGEGPILTYGPDKDYKLMKFLAGYSPLKVQETVSVAGGTNTSAIQLASTNCKTALISIPQRNMHTPVEVCSWNDIEGCSYMIEGFLNDLKF